MSVEGGSISIGSIGPAAGGVSIGPSLSVGAEAGLSARFGPSILGPELLSSAIVNEGPVKGGLEMFKPIGQINFNTPELNAADAVWEAQSVLVQPPRPRLEGTDVPDVFQKGLSDVSLDPTLDSAAGLSPSAVQTEMIIAGVPQKPPELNNPLNVKEVLGEANYWLGISNTESQKVFSSSLREFDVSVGPKQSPNLYSTNNSTIVEQNVGSQAGLQTDTGNKVIAKISPAVSTQPALEEQKVEEILEEAVEQKTDLVEAEELDKEQRFYLVDKRALAQRIIEIRQAFKQAKAEAQKMGDSGKSILGKLIAKFIPLEHAGTRSAVVQPDGPDGSYEATKETIEARQFSSEDQAEAIALANRPVEIGKDGERAGDEEVKKVFKLRVVKPVKAIEIIRKRIIRKKAYPAGGHHSPPLFVVEQTEVITEPDLKVLGLEKVFPKAA